MLLHWQKYATKKAHFHAPFTFMVPFFHDFGYILEQGIRHGKNVCSRTSQPSFTNPFMHALWAEVLLSVMASQNGGSPVFRCPLHVNLPTVPLQYMDDEQTTFTITIDQCHRRSSDQYEWMSQMNLSKLMEILSLLTKYPRIYGPNLLISYKRAYNRMTYRNAI